MLLGCKNIKKIAVLIALLMLFGSISVPASLAAEPETVAAWDYSAAPASAVVPATSGTLAAGAALSNFKNAIPTYGTSSLSISGWDNGADTKCWQLSLSTTGYENLTLAAKTRSSGTGPRDFKVTYSLDNGNTWADVPGSAYTITSTTLKNNLPSASLPLPAETANSGNILIRFIMTSNISSRAGTGTYLQTETVASGGTSNINNIVITGTPVQSTVTVGEVTADPAGGTVALGSKAALSCATEGADIYYSINGGASVLYDPALEITLDTLPVSLSAYGTKAGMADGPIGTWDFTQAQTAKVTASPNGGPVKINSKVALTCADAGASIKYSLNGSEWQNYSSAITLSSLPASIKAYAIAEGMTDGPESVFDFTERTANYNLYFGQLHSHTSISDGTGTLDEAFGHAKNTAKVDFLAVTDHSNSFDNAVSSTMADGTKSTEWVQGHAAADLYTDSTFVGIYAYEMTWSNGTGHINTYNTQGFENRETQKYKDPDGLLQYYNMLKQFPDSISQFNHPGDTFGDFNDFAHYDPEIDRLISLIEVGNGEGAVGSTLYFPSYGSYSRALDKGWHVAPTNNQDNHLGLWGDANTARTVVLSDSLTRDGIYDAMRNMRVYATEDNNLRIVYTLNGEDMGTVFAERPDSVNIKIDLQDPDNEALGKVSVIADGNRTVTSETLTAAQSILEFDLAPNYSYYYIRVDEADGDTAVTAPIWIDEVDKAGIASVSTGSLLSMKGQPLTITTDLFNNENDPMNISGLEYIVNGSMVHTAPSMNPVAPFGTASYSFSYTPAEAGKLEVTARLTAVIGGVEKTYTDVLKLNIADPAVTTKIVVDASHYNDYVAGYYSGNMTNFVTLANLEGMNVIIQKEPLTADVLKDAELLVLSPPAKKPGTVNGVSYTASPYTDAEIEVIRGYAAAGGNIILTALADYQDNKYDPSNHSAYQQNRILAAIGAGTSINDDEVVDYDSNPNVNPPGIAGGTPFRVPMKTYNMDSPYLAGVQAKQTYSFYSGCSITMGSNAVWLVKGWPTTYGFDSDNDRLGGTYVSAANKTIPADTGIGKGNVVTVAEETLPGGGKLFVGGTVFYSNFEIKVQLDNYGQTQNSNYNIVMNILDSVRRVIPVTDISVIRAGNMGDVYCAQGTVTAGTTPGNAFFDTIYIEDATGGINIFPVSGTDIKVGQKVKVTGTLDQYQGDPELRMLELSITDPSINPIEPAVMSTQAAMNSMNGGRLIRVEGTVIRMDSQNLYIDDGSGEARIFVDGYIGDGTNDPAKLGKWDPNILVGDKVNAVGLASADSSGPRLRVRNTAEIVRIADTVPPVITVVGVENGDRFTLFETAAVQWSASDALSGIAASSGDIVSGENLDTETVGPHTLNFTASDNAGNAASLSITYYVEYDFSGFLSPAGMDKSFKAGSSIPVKFAITDAGAGYPADAAAKLYVARMTDGKAEDEFPAVSKSAAAEGNQFRYDTDSKQYIFNLDTKGFAPGEYRLRIDLGDGTVNILVITLK